MIKCPLCSSFKINQYHQDQELIYWLCADCELVFLNPTQRLSKESEKNRYLQHENSETSPGYLDFLQPLVQLVCRDSCVGQKGLDFGSGPNPVLSRLLQQAGFAVDAYDPFFAPQIPSTQYDFIVCCESAEHFFEPAKEFELIYKLLKKEKGSRLILSTLLWKKQEDFKNWHYRRDLTHASFYQEHTINWIREKFNFSRVEIHSNRLTELHI